MGNLIAAIEGYTAVEPELRELYPQHYNELATDKDIPLAPNYAGYRTLDANGCVFLVTLRDAGRLAGYFLGFLFPELHYQSCLACTGDIFYVRPEYRRGTAGLQMFRFAKRELKARGIQRWHVTTKLHQDCGALLRRVGFSPVEMHYSMRLD